VLKAMERVVSIHRREDRNEIAELRLHNLAQLYGLGVGCEPKRSPPKKGIEIQQATEIFQNQSCLEPYAI
jgi:hypothetical protein